MDHLYINDFERWMSWWHFNLDLLNSMDTVDGRIPEGVGVLKRTGDLWDRLSFHWKLESTQSFFAALQWLVHKHCSTQSSKPWFQHTKQEIIQLKPTHCADIARCHLLFLRGHSPDLVKQNDDLASRNRFYRYKDCTFLWHQMASRCCSWIRFQLQAEACFTSICSICLDAWRPLEPRVLRISIKFRIAYVCIVSQSLAPILSLEPDKLRLPTLDWRISTAFM